MENKLICMTCNKTFPTERGLKIHIKRVHIGRDESALLECKNCRHRYSVLNDGLCGNCIRLTKGFVKECPVCHEKKTFYANAQKMCSDCKEDQIKKHRDAIAARSESAICNICGLECASIRSLNRHKTVKHTDWHKNESWPECRNCHKHYEILKDGLCGHCNLNINGKDAICPQCHRQAKFYSNRQKVCNACRGVEER